MIGVTTSYSINVMATATCRRIRYHCTVCSSECEKRSISCVDCGRWTHIDCVGFCERVLDVRGIDFVCRTCAHCGEDDEYDWEKSSMRCVFIFALYRPKTVLI